MERALRSARWSRWALFLLAFLFIAINLRRTYTASRSDFLAYYEAARRLWLHLTPYQPDAGTPFKYAPPIAAFFLPFIALPYKAAEMAFAACSILCGLWVYRRIARVSGDFGALATFAATYRFHNQDLMNLQVNHVLLILLWLQFEWILRKREAIAGFAWAAVGFFKLLPLGALGCGLLALRRRWLAGAAIGLVAIGCIPILFGLSLDDTYREWFGLLHSTTGTPYPSWDIMQTIPGALFLWFFHREPSTAANIAILGLQGIVTAIGIAQMTALRREGPLSERRWILVLCWCLAYVTLFNPLGWKHNYVLLVPLVSVLVQEKEWKAYGIAALGLTALPVCLKLFPGDFADRSNVTTMGGIALWWGVWRLRKRSDLSFRF